MSAAAPPVSSPASAAAAAVPASGASEAPGDLMPMADPLGTWSVFTLTSPYTESARFGGRFAVPPPPADGRHAEAADAEAALDIDAEVDYNVDIAARRGGGDAGRLGNALGALRRRMHAGRGAARVVARGGVRFALETLRAAAAAARETDAMAHAHAQAAGVVANAAAMRAEDCPPGTLDGAADGVEYLLRLDDEVSRVMLTEANEGTATGREYACGALHWLAQPIAQASLLLRAGALEVLLPLLRPGNEGATTPAGRANAVAAVWSCVHASPVARARLAAQPGVLADLLGVVLGGDVRAAPLAMCLLRDISRDRGSHLPLLRAGAAVTLTDLLAAAPGGPPPPRGGPLPSAATREYAAWTLAELGGDLDTKAALRVAGAVPVLLRVLSGPPESSPPPTAGAAAVALARLADSDTRAREAIAGAGGVPVLARALEAAMLGETYETMRLGAIAALWHVSFVPAALKSIAGGDVAPIVARLARSALRHGGSRRQAEAVRYAGHLMRNLAALTGAIGPGVDVEAAPSPIRAIEAPAAAGGSPSRRRGAALRQ